MAITDQFRIVNTRVSVGSGQIFAWSGRCAAILALVFSMALLCAVVSSAQQTKAARDTVAVEAYNSIAITADRAGQVTLYDATNPAKPTLLSTVTVPMQLTGVALAGDSALVSGDKGVQILDISNPRSPLFIHNIQVESPASVVRAAGNLGYVAFGSTLAVFDIATGVMQDRRSYSAGPIVDLAMAGDSLYVLSSGEGTEASGSNLEAKKIAVSKIAIQDRLGPVLASWTAPESAHAALGFGTASGSGFGLASLYAGDNRVYLGGAGAGAASGIELLTDRGSSFTASELAPAGGLEQAVGAGAFRPSGLGLLAFIAESSDTGSRLGVLEIGDAARDSQVSGKPAHFTNTPGVAGALTLYRGYAYIASGASGLQVVPFAVPNGTKSLPGIALSSSLLAESSAAASLLRLSAQVDADDQIAKVDFYVNGELVASDGNFPFEYRALVDGSNDPSLTVQACATDLDGNATCSPVKDLSTQSAETLKVLSVSPAAGTKTPHTSKMTVSAQFSSALDASTVSLKNVSMVKLGEKSTSPSTSVALSAVTYQAGTKSIAIQPKSSLSTGAYQVTLAPAIRSAAGGALASSYSWTFNITAATIAWSNAEGGDWNTAANWKGGAVPANGDSVLISLTPGVKVTLSSGNPQVDNITVGAGNTLILQGGNLGVVGTGSIDTLNFSSGVLGGPGTVTVATAMSWTGGVISGNLTIAPKATMQVNTPFNPNGSFNLNGGVITNSGTVTQTFAGTPGVYTGFQISQGATIKNLTGGIWNVNGDVWIYPIDNTAMSFINTGIFNKSGGNNTTLWNVPLVGSGTLNIQSGTFNLGGVASTNTLTGPISIAARATLDLGQSGSLGGTSVTGAGTLNFTNSTTVANKYTFSGLTQIQGGTIDFNQATTIATLNLTGGTLGGAGPVTVTGNTDWTAGVITGALVIPAKATLQINTPFNPNGNFNMVGGSISNSGTVTQTFAGTPGVYTGFGLSQTATITNLTGGIWNVSGDIWIYPTDNSAVNFINTGTFNKSGGTGNTLWGIPLNGAGPINVQSGTLSLNGTNGSNKLTGLITIGAKTTLNFGQTGELDGTSIAGSGTLNFTNSATIANKYTFTGLTQIQAGTVAFTMPTTLATLNLSGGTLGGAGPVTVTGNMDWTGGVITGALVIPAKATLAMNTPFNPNGNFNIVGGSISNSGTVTQTFAGTPGVYTGFGLSQTATIKNLTGGIWNVAGDVWIYPTDNSAVSFTNTGTFNKTGGTGNTLWSIPMDGSGPINVQSGTLSLNGTLTTNKLTGLITIGAKTTLNYGQNGQLDGNSIAGSGTLNFTASTIIANKYTFTGLTQIQGGTIAFTMPTTIATLNLSGGTLAGAGPVTVTGNMDWTGGVITGALVIPTKATLQINTPFNPNGNFNIVGGSISNSGTVTQSFAGTPGVYTGFQLSQGATIKNLAGGIWNIANDVWIYPTDGSAVGFVNTGTLNKTGGTATTLWSIPLSSTGTINIGAGALTLNGNLAANKISGAVSIAAKTTLNFAQGGTLDESKLTGAGTMNFTASATATWTTNALNTFTGLTQIQAGNVAFSQPTAITTLNLINGTLSGPGAVTVTGTTDWTGGVLSAPLVIPAKATLLINTPFNPNGDFNLIGGSISNSGTVTQTFAGTPGVYTGFQFSQGATISNNSTGVWNLASDIWMYPIDSSATGFLNAGTLNKTGGTSTSYISIPLTGSGPINLQSGTLNLNGSYGGAKIASVIAISSKAALGYGQGGTFDGSSVTGSGTLNFIASATVGAKYSFAGLTQIQAGTVNFSDPTTIANLNLTGGALGGPGPVTVTGNTDWTGGAITGALVIPAKATLQINTPFNPNGNFNLTGGSIVNSGTVNQSFAGTPGTYTGWQVSQAGTIINQTSGVWNILTDVWIESIDSSENSFTNAGTINKTGGTGNSIFNLAFTNTGTLNITSGTISFTGTYAGSQISGTINITAPATVAYAQQGTLMNGTVSGTGTLDLTPTNTNSGTTSIAGATFTIKAPVQISGGSLEVQAGATLNASNLTLINANFSVVGNTSIGKLNVSATAGNSTGSTVSGAGTINVTDTLTWGLGTVTFNGTFNVQNMSFSPNSSMSFQLGSSAISVNAKLSLNGNLSLSFPKSNPSVGTAFKILNFANNYFGNFLDDLLDIPIPGTNDFYKESLTSSGLSFVVTQNPPSS